MIFFELSSTIRYFHYREGSVGSVEAQMEKAWVKRDWSSTYVSLRDILKFLQDNCRSGQH